MKRNKIQDKCCRFKKKYRSIKPFGAGIIFLILAHPVYKM